MLRREFEPRHDLAIYFDTIASASIVFGPFLGGAIALILLIVEEAVAKDHKR